MKPGDLVRLISDDIHSDADFWVGGVGGFNSWTVKLGTIALITKFVPDRSGAGDGDTVHILVDGKMGWVYVDDCEVIDET